MRMMAGPSDTYRQAIERLYGLERGKGALGLEGTRLLLDALGRPEEAFRSVHVAGTNGKGSTSTLLERSLRAAGLRTGLFTSPHLVDFRERMRVNGAMAPPESIERGLAKIESSGAAQGRTFFEVTFALACLHFAEQGVEVAVLETGLGGRLDSTNVVRPELCVLTAVGLDHTDMLGGTLGAIAGEKAGILKPGVPAVTAPQEPEAMAVLERRASELGVRLERAGDRARIVPPLTLGPGGAEFTLDLVPHGAMNAHLALLGRHQLENALSAAAAFAVLAGEPAFEGQLRPEALLAGLARARWPGRFEICPADPRLVWDGAHNPAGARMAREAWREVLGDPAGVLVLGIAEDKDPAGMLDALAGPWRKVIAVSAAAARARPATEMRALVASAWPGVPVETATSVAEGVHQALDWLGPDERAFVSGSLFVVAEAMTATGLGAIECL